MQQASSKRLLEHLDAHAPSDELAGRAEQLRNLAPVVDGSNEHRIARRRCQVAQPLTERTLERGREIGAADHELGTGVRTHSDRTRHLDQRERVTGRAPEDVLALDVAETRMVPGQQRASVLLGESPQFYERRFDVGEAATVDPGGRNDQDTFLARVPSDEGDGFG